METIQLENLINPEETLNREKETLFAIYQEDYHLQDNQELEKRWNNTIFILEGNPKDKYIFWKNRMSQLPPTKRNRIYLEWIDYEIIRKRSIQKAQNKFLKYLIETGKIYQNENKKEIWNLDWEAYQIRNSSEARKHKYQIECIKLGMDSITNWEELDEIIRTKKTIEQEAQREIIKKSIWGKRIQRKAKGISIQQLEEILFDQSTNATTCVVETEGGLKTICFIPWERQIEKVSLDRVFFHELRHVIETKNKRTGLTDFQNPKYDRMNEVRTEKNAIRDEKRILILFGRQPKKIQCLYELFFNTIENLEEYQEYLNIQAFRGKIDESFLEDLDWMERRIKKAEKEYRKKREAQ